MSSKTYVSASISWLYGDTKEWRYALNTEAETVLGGGNLFEALIKRQKKNHKANYDNYIQFCKNPQHWLQPNTETKDRWQYFGNGTYEKWLKIGARFSILTAPNKTKDEIAKIIADSGLIPDLDSSWKDIGIKEFKMLGKMPDGNEREVVISSQTMAKQNLIVKVCSSGHFRAITAAECMLYDTSLPYWEKIRLGLACEATVYQLIDGGTNDGGEEGEIASTEDQVVVKIGYEYNEKHEVQKDPTSDKLTEVEMSVFHVDEAHVLEPNVYNTGESSYLYLAYFITESYEIDSYQIDGNYLVLDSLGFPIKLEGKMPAKFVLEHKREGHDQIIVDKYVVDFDIESIDAGYAIVPESKVNSLGLGELYEKPKMDVAHEPYPLCLRYEGSWLTNNDSYVRALEWLFYCTQKNWSALSSIDKNLRETNNIEDTKFIHIGFGLSTNLGQYGYVAHYIVQLVKQLLGANNKIGEEFHIKRGELWPKFYYKQINYNCEWHLTNLQYKSGKGKCPYFVINKYTKSWYAGCGGLGTDGWWYWQRTKDTWDAAYVEVENRFIIKNGVAQHWNTDKWKEIITAKGSKTYVRQYANSFFPIIKEVLDCIPLNDAIDVLQYAPFCIISNYKIVKKKWYQTGLFKILLVIISVVVTAVVSFFNPPAGIAIGGFWSSLAYAAFSAVISVAINTIVASLATIFLKPVLTKIFGDFIGELLNQLITIATASVLTLSLGEFMYSNGFWDASQTWQITGYHYGFNLQQNIYNKFFDAGFLQRAIGAVEKGISYYQAKKLEAIKQEQKKTEEEYERKMLALGVQARKEFGDGTPAYVKNALVKKMIYDQHVTMATMMSVDSKKFVKQQLIRGKDYCERITSVGNSKVFVETTTTLRLLNGRAL